MDVRKLKGFTVSRKFFGCFSSLGDFVSLRSRPSTSHVVGLSKCSYFGNKLVERLGRD